MIIIILGEEELIVTKIGSSVGLSIDQMKRRNESEEYQDFEMSGWNGFTSSEPSHALTPSGPGRKGSRSKAIKQFKNAPQTPGGSANGGVFFPSTGISVWNAFIIL